MRTIITRLIVLGQVGMTDGTVMIAVGRHQLAATVFGDGTPTVVIEPRPLGDGVFAYDSPAPEFRLYRAEPGPAAVTLPGTCGARVVLCTEGTGTARANSGALKVAKGESCYLSAADGAVTASGPAALFIAGNGIGC